MRLLTDRFVWLGVITWIGFALAVPFLARGVIPFDRPMLAKIPYQAQILREVLWPVFSLFVISVVWLLTRRRTIPDVAARAPERAIALRETVCLLSYGAVVLLGGQFIGPIFGRHGIGLHMTGSMFGLTDTVTPREACAWAIYNFIFYAAIPYIVFRARGYSREALCLKSANVRNDALVILVVLALSCLGGLPSGLTTRQLSIGGGLTFLLSLFGTGLPVMIFLCAILIPRYHKLTGSTAASVLLGGLTYAAMHLTEYWTRYDTPSHGALSLIFIFLFYGGPGLVKAYLTLRTGNAWVHLWGWHALAPHVTMDTPIFVRIFNL